MNAFITYNQFLKQQYIIRCENKKVAEIYAQEGGFKTFKTNNTKCYGFSEYLIHIRGNKVTALQTYHLAKMFYVYGKRSPSTLPMVLASVSRQYDIELPAVYGILTKEYWQTRFDDSILN